MEASDATPNVLKQELQKKLMNTLQLGLDTESRGEFVTALDEYRYGMELLVQLMHGTV